MSAIVEATPSIDPGQLATVCGAAEVGQVVATGLGGGTAGAVSFGLGATAVGVIGGVTGVISKQSAYWSKRTNLAVAGVAALSGLSGAYYAGKAIWNSWKK